MSLNTNLFSAAVGTCAAGAYLYTALPASNAGLFYPVIRSVGVGVAAYLFSNAAIGASAWIRRQILLQSVHNPDIPLPVRMAMVRLNNDGIVLTQRMVDLLMAHVEHADLIRREITRLGDLPSHVIDRLIDNEERAMDNIFAIALLSQARLLTEENINVILTEDAGGILFLVHECLRRTGMILEPEQRALLEAHPEHAFRIILGINNLDRVNLRIGEQLAFLAEHGNENELEIRYYQQAVFCLARALGLLNLNPAYADSIALGIADLEQARILTENNYDVLMARDGEQTQEIVHRMGQERVLNQQVFDEIIGDIEGRRVAEVLGEWNGGISDQHKGDLRIPAEVIDDIAAFLGPRARESAGGVAEQIERRIRAN